MNCSINRPGGFRITDRALNFCQFPKGVNILDLGCGSGATVDYLIHDHGFSAIGLDIDPKYSHENQNVIYASAEKIPVLLPTMDAVIMECSFSLMEKQELVLMECKRVLKTHGYLIISEIFALDEAANLKGSLGRIATKHELTSLLNRNGFKIVHFEDYSDMLRTYWGQMIFEKGAVSFYNELGICPESLKRVKCGYCLIIALKEEIPV